MRNKIILIVMALFMLLDFSSCVMREPRETHNHFSPSHTRRHYGRERHMSVRRAYWGKHRSGMRPYKHRGQIRY